MGVCSVTTICNPSWYSGGVKDNHPLDENIPRILEWDGPAASHQVFFEELHTLNEVSASSSGSHADGSDTTALLEKWSNFVEEEVAICSQATSFTVFELWFDGTIFGCDVSPRHQVIAFGDANLLHLRYSSALLIARVVQEVDLPAGYPVGQEVATKQGGKVLINGEFMELAFISEAQPGQQKSHVPLSISIGPTRLNQKSLTTEFVQTDLGRCLRQFYHKRITDSNSGHEFVQTSVFICIKLIALVSEIKGISADSLNFAGGKPLQWVVRLCSPGPGNSLGKTEPDMDASSTLSNGKSPRVSVNPVSSRPIRRRLQKRPTKASLTNLPECPLVGCSLSFLEMVSEWVLSEEDAPVGTSYSDGFVEAVSDPVAGDTVCNTATMGGLLNALIKPTTSEPESKLAKEGMKALLRGVTRDIREGARQRLVPPAWTASATESTNTAPAWTSSAAPSQYESSAAPSQYESLYSDNGRGSNGKSVSFAELAMRENLLDNRQKPAFSKATHFVSHAWRYVFPIFVAAVKHWVETTGISQDAAYFWVDAFVVNQHQAQNFPQEWWSTRFMQAIGAIGNTVLVLEPWDNPVPFQRAWVVWEMYCTSVTGARLHITMRPEMMAHFNKALLTSFERVQTALSTIDVAKSRASNRRDQEMIHREIELTIGFTKLNELIQTRMMQWLMSSVKSCLQDMKDDDVLGKPNSRMKLSDNLARMQREFGNLAEAETSFGALLEEAAERLGPRHPFTMSCMNQLAVTLQKTGHKKEATRMHRLCRKRREQVLGVQHADTLQSTSNLAILLASEEPMTSAVYEEAQQLFKWAVSGKEETSGPSHPSTLYTVSNLAKLLSHSPAPSMELFEEAEKMHQRCVDELVNTLHEAHPLTLTVSHNQACHWLAMVAFRLGSEDSYELRKLLSKCSEQLHAVHISRTGKLGKMHPDTLLTEQAVNACSRLQREIAPADQQAYETWAELSLHEFLEAYTYEHFFQMRCRVRRYGVEKLRAELVSLGIVAEETGDLTLGMQPFNIFARLGAGVQEQTAMKEQQKHLGRFQDEFMIACNKTEADDMWNSSEPAWIGKASMSKRHRYLILKNIHWEWFNVLTFGMLSGLLNALEKLKNMREAALLWVKAQSDWSEKVGLYLHVYAHSSVPSLHLHILDLQCLGPTWEKLRYKSLRIDDAIEVIEAEMRDINALAEMEAMLFESERRCLAL